MHYSRGDRGAAEEPLLHPLDLVEHGGPLERHVERTLGERNRTAVSGSRSRETHPAATWAASVRGMKAPTPRRFRARLISIKVSMQAFLSNDRAKEGDEAARDRPPV